ncbi:hypothetical protein ACWEPM_37990 [Streptomyces sp. NPDC004244]
MADALLDPVMEELAWADSGREQIRRLSADGGSAVSWVCGWGVRGSAR